MTYVPIKYQLFRQVSGEMVPVTSQTDRDLEDALSAADPSQDVPQDPDPADQGDIIDTHCAEVLYQVEVEGHEVVFPHLEDSRWDSTVNDWAPVVDGGSVVFAVPEYGEPANTAELFLQVTT